MIYRLQHTTTRGGIATFTNEHAAVTVKLPQTELNAEMRDLLSHKLPLVVEVVIMMPGIADNVYKSLADLRRRINELESERRAEATEEELPLVEN